MASSILSHLGRKRLGILCVIPALCLALGGFLGIRALTDPYDCRIQESVTVGGLKVGGMTRSEARKAVKAASEEILSGQALEVALPEETLRLSPSDTGIRLNVRRAVRAAYRYGRSEAQTDPDIGLGPYLTYDQDRIRQALEAYAARYDTALSEPRWEPEGDAPELGTDRYDESAPCQTLLLTLGTPEAKLDVDNALEQIATVYDRAFGEDYQVTVTVTPKALPKKPDLDALYREFCVAPTDDALDLETYAFVPGSYGCAFDPEAAQAMVAEADWGETIAIPMDYVEPDILGDEVYFRDVLGSCETKHNNNENRNTNLRLLCQALDGFVLEPGETFSYNDTLGERTAEKGYLPAPAYSGNRLVDSIGGGVCQGSTTLYNCVLLADLEVVFRASHGAAVSYVPMGLDAAVNWGTTDFQFRNNFHFPIKITAEVSDGYVRMQILGTDEKDYYIEMTSGYGASNETVTYAVSYKNKYSKETGELISKEREAFSSYYNLG